MVPKPLELSWSDDTVDKLDDHGLTVADAFAVFERAPVFLTQESRPEPDAVGRTKIRPQRIRMIGPGRTRIILTFVIEYPDAQEVSFIVTGFRSPRHDRDIYAQVRRLQG